MNTAVQDPEVRFVYSDISQKGVTASPLLETYSPWQSHQQRHYYESMLRPLFLLQKVFGVSCESSTSLGLPSRFGSPQLWYHCLVVLMAWFNFLRYFGAYNLGEEFGMDVATKVTLHVVFLWLATCVSCGIRISRKKTILFKAWTRYIDQYGEAPKAQLKTERRRLIITMVIICCCFIVNFFVVVYSLFIPEAKSIHRYQILPVGDICDPDAMSMKYFIPMLVIDQYLVAICVSQLGYLYLMVMGISDEFRRFNQTFAGSVAFDSNGKGRLVGELEPWRRRHLELCRLSEKVDNMFGLNNLLAFLFNIPACSMMSSRIILSMAEHSDFESFYPALCTMCLSFVSSLSILLVIINCGTKLQAQATASKVYLYSLEMDGPEWTTKTVMQFNAFYKRVVEGQIGITGWRLFYINKLTMKMVCLMIVSYCVILMKFGQHTDNPFHCPPPTQQTNTSFATYGLH